MNIFYPNSFLKNITNEKGGITYIKLYKSLPNIDLSLDSLQIKGGMHYV